MTTLETSIVIDQEPELVWEVFTDFESYKHWNPFFLDMGSLTSSNLDEDRNFIEKIQMPGGIPGFFPMKVSKLKNLELIEFSMSSTLLGPLIFDRHRFHLKEIDGKTVFTHIYEYTGVVFRLALSFNFIRNATINIHRLMNERLKQQVHVGKDASY